METLPPSFFEDTDDERLRQASFAHSLTMPSYKFLLCPGDYLFISERQDSAPRQSERNENLPISDGYLESGDDFMHGAARRRAGEGRKEGSLGVRYIEAGGGPS